MLVDADNIEQSSTVRILFGLGEQFMLHTMLVAEVQPGAPCFMRFQVRRVNLASASVKAVKRRMSLCLQLY